MTTTDSLISTAAQHLAIGAEAADAQRNPALAAQIRLAAAVLPTTADTGSDIENVHDRSILDHLDGALECLDSIHPLAGPPDLQLAAWHIHELRRIASNALAS